MKHLHVLRDSSHCFFPNFMNIFFLNTWWKRGTWVQMLFPHQVGKHHCVLYTTASSQGTPPPSWGWTAGQDNLTQKTQSSCAKFQLLAKKRRDPVIWRGGLQETDDNWFSSHNSPNGCPSRFHAAAVIWQKRKLQTFGTICWPERPMCWIVRFLSVFPHLLLAKWTQKNLCDKCVYLSKTWSVYIFLTFIHHQWATMGVRRKKELTIRWCIMQAGAVPPWSPNAICFGWWPRSSKTELWYLVRDGETNTKAHPKLGTHQLTFCSGWVPTRWRRRKRTGQTSCAVGRLSRNLWEMYSFTSTAYTANSLFWNISFVSCFGIHILWIRNLGLRSPVPMLLFLCVRDSRSSR